MRCFSVVAKSHGLILANRETENICQVTMTTNKHYTKYSDRL